MSLSIVIPCYNSALFLPDALASVRSYKGNHRYEIIVVNDGSTDIPTLTMLEKIQKEGIKVLHQENKGPAAARNTGVRNAEFDLILFLDSDNKIRSNEFIDTGVEILNRDQSVAVVYGNPSFFGETDRYRDFTSRPFDMMVMLGHNYIDMCSMVRKNALKDVGGLDENRMIIGHEDWDLWLRIAKKGWSMHYCDKTFFDYRIRKNSLIEQTLNSETGKNTDTYILSKHRDILPQYYTKLYSTYGDLKFLVDMGLIGQIKYAIKKKIKGFLGMKK